MFTLAVDFDGTVVDHAFPAVGAEVPDAADWLRKLVAAGARLVLWTMRSGATLAGAVAWYGARDIPLLGVNENPEQASWTSSPKAYAHAYVDDLAVGCPMITHPDTGRPCVDWSVVGPAVLALVEAHRRA